MKEVDRKAGALREVLRAEEPRRIAEAILMTVQAGWVVWSEGVKEIRAQERVEVGGTSFLQCKRRGISDKSWRGNFEPAGGRDPVQYRYRHRYRYRYSLQRAEGVPTRSLRVFATR